MPGEKNIFVIIGSASSNSANLKLIEVIAVLSKDIYNLKIFNDLKLLPHFDPELSNNNPPNQVIEFRENIEKADGVLICTPEYIFSIPSGLKNAIEWCISTTIFSEKPCGLITASANGEKAHEELQLIMRTAMAKYTDQTVLLIQGIKGKFDFENNFTDSKLIDRLNHFINAFYKLINQ